MLDTFVTNVKVKYIRSNGYNNLKEWCECKDNVYIGRKGIVFIKNDDGTKEIYPKKDSKWANPFKLNATNDRKKVISDYENYIKNSPLLNDLIELKGKNLGCWCVGETDYYKGGCHGDVLKKLIDELNV